MGRFYCKIWDQNINEKQCFLITEPSSFSKNPHCLKCPKHKVLQELETINIDLPKNSIEKPKEKDIARQKSIIAKSKFLRPHFRNDELITKIKKDIPVIKSLHSSFWGGFWYWQLLRLNKDYQEDMEKFWNAVWKCLAYFANKFPDWKERFEMVSDSQLFYTDFYPRINDTYGTWSNFFLFSLFRKDKVGDFSQRYPSIIYYGKSADFWSKYGKPIFWKGRILNAKFRPHETPDIEVEFGSADKKVKIKIGRLGNLYPPPIPHEVRFPFPFETRFAFLLDTDPQLPKLQNLRSLRSKLHPKTGRPRKEDWATNLLVYELSQAGMKNMEIARLLFGIDRSTEYMPDRVKHPILVKIDKIKKRIESYVSETYPFICP